MNTLEPRRLAMIGAATPAAPVVLERDGVTTLYDFCLMPYAASHPASGRVASETMLLASFAHDGLLSEGSELVAALKAALGPQCTVFGIKRHADAAEFLWEFYFYRRDHTPPQLSVELVRRCFPCELTGHLPADISWQFFSIEVGKAQLQGAAPATITVYQEGRDLAWKIRQDGLELANMYKVFDARGELSAFLPALRASVHLPAHPRALAAVLPPELLLCWRIWLAHKRHSDTIYWQRVNSAQALWALSWARWPAEFTRIFKEQAPFMGHLRWDLGADFRRRPPTDADDPGVFVSGLGLHASF